MDKQIILYIIAAVVGYLLGNVQIAVVMSKLRYRKDIREHGSGNAGSTNMLRTFGVKAGIFTFICDFIKGVLAFFIGKWICGNNIGAYICGLSTVIGHDFPVFFGFKGGKGVATSFGLSWIMCPWPCGVFTTIVVFITMFTTGIVSLGSIVSTAFYLVLISAITPFDSIENILKVVTIAILLLLMIIRHTENIKRILKGEERSFRKKKDKQ